MRVRIINGDMKLRQQIWLVIGACLTLSGVASAQQGVEVGAPAPDFALPDLDGKTLKLSEFRGKTVVLEWFNPECPFIKAAHGSSGSLLDAPKRHTKAGVVWLAINSAASGKQGYGAERNREAKRAMRLEFPVLLDEKGEVGKKYGATNTPHLFVIDKAGKVVYRGAADNSPDGEGTSPTGGKLLKYVDAALEDLKAGRPVATPSTKPYGCSVKYAP
jgi:peroxiredoxin